MDRKSDATLELLKKGREINVENKKRKARTAQSYLKAVVGQITRAQMKALANKVMEQAMKGDPKAREWLGKYVLGNGKFDLRDLGAPSILKRS